MQRRTILKTAAMAALAPRLSRAAQSTGTSANLHDTAARAAAELARDADVRLLLMYPAGSLSNIEPLARDFEQRTGIGMVLTEVPLDAINDEILVEAQARRGAFDVALPATFGLPDLVESGILANLDRHASRHEPPDLQAGSLFSVGDYYKGSLYGYQADGDTYMMFYRRSWLENEDNAKRYADKYGQPLATARTWDELDRQMAFFHAPSKGRYGGLLFRREFYGAWEWWIRFHAKGLYPFSDDLEPRIGGPEGVAALSEMVAATRYLHPGTEDFGLFENFEAFGRGQTFCNIGWGGTQKYLNEHAPAVAADMAYGSAPGGLVDGRLIRTPYFNWGWNYVVSSITPWPEIAYLFTLFASSPAKSLESVRQAGGYLDPFRVEHYDDPELRRLYSPTFLTAHENSMRDSIPDLYLKGYVEYFDELRLNVRAAVQRTKTPRQAMGDTASAWRSITDRMGKRSQKVQWAFLKSSYPAHLRAVLR